MKPEQKEKLIKAINGEITLTIKDVKKDNLHIIINDTPILLVRGWGYLTGKLGLSEEEAIKEQEELLEYVEKKIKRTILKKGNPLFYFYLNTSSDGESGLIVAIQSSKKTILLLSSLCNFTVLATHTSLAIPAT